jgi:hypothetical protein
LALRFSAALDQRPKVGVEGQDTLGHSQHAGFLTSPAQVGGCSAGYVRDAELFKDHAGAACSKGLAPVPQGQLRQPKRRMSDWAFCGDGSCARAAWMGRRFGKGGVRTSCTGWGGACASAAQAWN